MKSQLRTFSLAFALAAGIPQLSYATRLTLSDSQPGLVLGQGYDSRSEGPAAHCLAPDLPYSYVSQQSGDLIVGNTIQESELESELGFTFGARTRFGLTSASANANYLARTTSSDFAQAFNYRFNAGIKQVRISFGDRSIPQRLSTAFRRAIRQRAGGAFEATENFTRQCGNEFVVAIDRGIRLYVSTQLRFGEERHTREFRGRVRASGNWGAIESALQSLSSEARRSVAISVTAYQLGGDTTSLGRIFESAGGDRDTLGEYNFLNCSMENLQACRQLHANIMHYGNVTLRSQLGSLDYQPSQSSSSAANLAYHTASYSELPLLSDPTLLAPDLRISREEIEREFDRQLRGYRRLMSMSQARRSSGSLSMDDSDRLDQAIDQTRGNLSYIAQASVRCFDGDLEGLQRSCSEAATQVRSYVRSASRRIPRDLLVSPDVLCQSAGCTHCANVGTEARPEYQCLRCQRTVGELNGGAPLTVRGGQQVPVGAFATCAHMPENVGVTIVGHGPHGNCSGPGSGSWWGDVFMNATVGPNGDIAGVNGSAANQTGSAHLAHMVLRGQVPASGTVTVSYGSSTCQGAAGLDQYQSFDPSFSFTISADELLLRHFGIAE